MQSGSNDMGGLAINEYLNDQAAAQVIEAIAARQQARTDAAIIKMGDMPQGDLFIVSSGDRHDGPSQRLVTTSREKAFAQFNAELATNYVGDIVVVVSYRSIDDEFLMEDRASRDGAYVYEATGSEDYLG